MDKIEPHDIYQTADLRSAVSGNRFSFSASASKKASFHGEKIGSSFVVFVYDTASRVPVYKLRLDDPYEHALSPSGTQIAVASAHELRVYSIP